MRARCGGGWWFGGWNERRVVKEHAPQGRVTLSDSPRQAPHSPADLHSSPCLLRSDGGAREPRGGAAALPAAGPHPQRAAAAVARPGALLAAACRLPAVGCVAAALLAPTKAACPCTCLLSRICCFLPLLPHCRCTLATPTPTRCTTIRSCRRAGWPALVAGHGWVPAGACYCLACWDDLPSKSPEATLRCWPPCAGAPGGVQQQPPRGRHQPVLQRFLTGLIAMEGRWCPPACRTCKRGACSWRCSALCTARPCSLADASAPRAAPAGHGAGAGAGPAGPVRRGPGALDTCGTFAGSGFTLCLELLKSLQRYVGCPAAVAAQAVTPSPPLLLRIPSPLIAHSAPALLTLFAGAVLPERQVQRQLHAGAGGQQRVCARERGGGGRLSMALFLPEAGSRRPCRQVRAVGNAQLPLLPLAPRLQFRQTLEAVVRSGGSSPKLAALIQVLLQHFQVRLVAWGRNRGAVHGSAAPLLPWPTEAGQRCMQCVLRPKLQGAAAAQRRCSSGADRVQRRRPPLLPHAACAADAGGGGQRARDCVHKLPRGSDGHLRGAAPARAAHHRQVGNRGEEGRVGSAVCGGRATRATCLRMQRACCCYRVRQRGCRTACPAMSRVPHALLLLPAGPSSARARAARAGRG